MFALLLSTALAADAWDLEPSVTRAGSYRFLLPDERDQELTDGLLARLRDGDEDAAVRQALVEALPRSGGDWSAVTALYAAEVAPVRATMVDGARHADPELATTLVRLALADADWEVRAAGARAAGWQTELGDALAADVLGALDDGHPEVRAFAARSAGWLALDAFAQVEPLLSDVDPTVRLNSLRALERMDEDRLRTLPVLATLEGDADPRIARAVAGLR